MVLDKWLDGIEAKVRVHGGRIEVIIGKNGSGISLGGITDISPLGVAYYQYVIGDIFCGKL